MEIITRICSKCKRDLPLSNYVWRFKSKGIRKHNCKDCDKIYKAEYYRNNSEKCKAKVAQDKRDRVALFKQYKSNLKCAACPESESCVIDFHHVDPTTKKFDVSQKVWETSWDTLLIEINAYHCARIVTQNYTMVCLILLPWSRWMGLSFPN